MFAYTLHARRTPAPVLDFSLFRIPTFRASVIGGFMFRLGIGALPFLLPLLLQVGFGLSPLQSGLVTFVSAVGAMGMKTQAARIINYFGFRSILVANAIISAVFLAACAVFTPATSVAVMLATLLVGGFFRSLQFTAINTLAYADIDARQMSRATSLASVGQQLSLSAGVAVGALVVDLSLAWRGETALTAADFAPAFLVVAAISAASAFVFARLPADAGAEMSGRKPVTATETSDHRIG
jgi:MFS family permease